MAMFKSIPARRIVSVTPAVLGTGGSPLSFNSVYLTSNENVPANEVISFASASGVAEFFGETSAEYAAAVTYFNGYNNSTIKPSALFFYRYNANGIGAYIRGIDLSAMTLTDLQALTGNVSVKIGGTTKSGTGISLAAATSFSNAAVIIGTAIGANVQFDTQLQAFEIHSGTTGASSTIEYATGTLAKLLGLTQAEGATLSVGTDPDAPTETMNGIVKSSQNWVTFTYIEEPSLAAKIEFAKWSNGQLDRYQFVCWGKEAAALVQNNKTCFGAVMTEAQYDGVVCIYGDLEIAAFYAGAVASIDWTEKQGRITLNFKGQSGISAQITDEGDAATLEANGYNYYGAWATANDRFLFLSPGSVPGQWKWADEYLNQIRLNSQFQLAMISGLTQIKSLPYNAAGRAIQRAWAQDPINEALNFGSIQFGVNLSEQQKSIINREAGFDASSQIEANGYYLLISQATAQVRGLRQSNPMKFWYTSGGSVHQINMASIDIL